MLARVYAMTIPSVCASVCVSVCLSVTRVLCIKTAKRFVEILLLPDSPITLVFRHRGSLLNSNGFTPNGTPNTRGGEKIWRFLTNKSVYLALRPERQIALTSKLKTAG